MKRKTKVAARIQATAWATPREGMTTEELTEKLISQGQEVLGVEGGRVKVLHSDDTCPGPEAKTVDVYECEKCGKWSMEYDKVKRHEQECQL